MVRVIRSGKVEEKICFPVVGNTKPRAPKSKGSLARKQDQNERDGIKRTARIINSNYEAGDLMISLDWSDSALEKLSVDMNNIDALREAADHEAVKFLRRLVYHMRKYGTNPVYMLFTSDMDGDTGEVVRVHHHMLIKKDGMEMKDGKIFVYGKELEKIWKNGGINHQSLYRQDSYAKLAAYLYRQVRRIEAGDFKYHGSTNLKKPVLVSERIVHSNRRLRLPKGAKLITRTEKDFMPDGTQYLCYVMPDKKPKRGGRKRE